MKKIRMRIWAFVLLMSVLFSATPLQTVQAAQKAAVTNQTEVEAGATAKYTIKNLKKTQYAKVVVKGTAKSGVTVRVKNDKGKLVKVKASTKIMGTGKNCILYVRNADMAGKQYTLCVKIYNKTTNKLVRTIQTKGTSIYKRTTALSISNLKKLPAQFSVGQTFVLKAKRKPVTSTQELQWSSGSPSVIEIDNDGKMTAKSVGEAEITVKSGSKSAKATVAVVPECVVATQAELMGILAEMRDGTLAIRTEEKAALTIPAANVAGIDLIVDAPNADIVNNGVFKSITIKQIAEDTWTENAKGNVLVLDASAGRIVIPEAANISEIKVIGSNSNFKLVVEGAVDKITLDAKTAISIDISGTVGSVAVNTASKLTIDGESSQAIPISVGESADGTAIHSNVAVAVDTASKTELNLSKGAEGSTVSTTSESAAVELSNKTDGSVTVTDRNGNNNNVTSGGHSIVDGNGNAAPSGGSSNNGGSGSGPTAGTSGGGSSGGSSGGSGSAPSHAFTTIVTGFKPISYINAGTYVTSGAAIGSPVKTVEEVVAEMPTTVTGITEHGDVIFNVSSWENTDGYSENSLPGYYTFTAVLGDALSYYTSIKDGVKASVKVYVKPDRGEIKYTNTGTYYEDVNKFELVSDQEIGDYLVLKLKYSGEPYMQADVIVNYYDEAGDLIKQASNYSYFEKDDVSSMLFDLPRNSQGTALNYSAYTINIGSYRTSYISVKDKLVIGEPSEITADYVSESGYGRYFCTLPITNNGTTEIYEGKLTVYFWKGTEEIGVRTEWSSGIVGKETTERKIWWYADEENGYAVPDGVTVEYNYAHIRNGDTTQQYEHKSIVYTHTGTYYEDVNKFELVSDQEIGDYLVLKLKYSGEPYMQADVIVNYYDEAGDLIKQASNYSYFEKDDVSSMLFDLPRNSQGTALNYSAYTINIGSYRTSYISVKDKLVIGEPSEITADYVSPNGYGEYSCKIPITNNGTTEIYGGQLTIYFWKGTEIIGVSWEWLGGIVGKETTERKIWWYANEENGYAVPDGVTVEYNYAYIRKSE